MSINENTQNDAAQVPVTGQPTPLARYPATPFVDYIFQGVRDLISETFAVQKPEMVLTNDWIHYFAQRFRNQDQNITYPIIYYMPRNFTRNDSSYSAAKLSKSPFSVTYGYIDGVFVLNRMIPVVFDIEVFYVTNDPMTLIKFANDWMFHSVSGQLDFSVDYLNSSFSVQVKCSESFSIPENDLAGETLNQAIASGTITVNGYTNQVWKIDRELPEFKQVQPTFSISLNSSSVLVDSPQAPIT